jgi:hypothetical protein
MTDERLGAVTGMDDEQGGDVAATTRDPDAIQKEIEQTRAELAETIDAIADRISPKRAASRSAQAVKASVSSVFGGADSAPAAVIDAPAKASGNPDPATRTAAVREIASSGGGAAYTGSREFTVARKLRTDRVLLVVGVGAAVAGLLVLRRSRR